MKGKLREVIVDMDIRLGLKSESSNHEPDDSIFVNSQKILED
jgi:hypothetical protein